MGEGVVIFSLYIGRTTLLSGCCVRFRSSEIAVSLIDWCTACPLKINTHVEIYQQLTPRCSPASRELSYTKVQASTKRRCA